MGAIALGLFLSEQMSPLARDSAASALVGALGLPGCAAAALAAAGGVGAVDALIAAAQRDGDPQQDKALLLLAQLAEADDGARERATSAAEALLPVIVEQIRAAAAGGASFGSVMTLQGPLLLLRKLVGSTAESTLEHAQALATSGLAAAAVDLLMALGSEEWAAAREEWTAAREEWTAAREEWTLTWEELEAAMIAALVAVMSAGGTAGASACDALSSRGALSRVLTLLRSPHQEARVAASSCIVKFTSVPPLCDALFLVPRAASELAAAMRRAHADGEHPLLTQCHAVRTLTRLLSHRQGARIADGLVRAVMAEGSAGSLLGALAGLLRASMEDTVFKHQHNWNMLDCSVAVLTHMVRGQGPSTLRLVPVLRRAPLAEECVRALRHWLAEADDVQMMTVSLLVYLVAAWPALRQRRRAPQLPASLRPPRTRLPCVRRCGRRAAWTAPCGGCWLGHGGSLPMRPSRGGSQRPSGC
jgi:hypothetical protein